MDNGVGIDCESKAWAQWRAKRKNWYNCNLITIKNLKNIYEDHC